MSNDNESIQVNMDNFDPRGVETTIQIPKLSEWRCIAFGVSYTPVKGYHPNWFHRQMCWLLLGVRWVKNVESE